MLIGRPLRVMRHQVTCAFCGRPVFLGWSMYRSVGERVYHTEKDKPCLERAGIPFNQSTYGRG